MLLLPLLLLAAAPAGAFTPVDLTPATNVPHTRAFAAGIGFQTWFGGPQVTLRGIPFLLATGENTLIRLESGQQAELALPQQPTAALQFLVTGGYLPAPGTLTVEITYTNGFREEHALEVADWNYGERYPELLGRNLEPQAFGGQGKSFYVQRLRLRRTRLTPASLRLTAGDRGTFLIAGVTLEGFRTQAEQLAPLPPGDVAILTAEDADPILRFAAEQLQLYLSRMEGKRPSINGPGSRRIYLGQVPADLAASPRATLAAVQQRLRPDGFALRSVGDSLVILGGGSRGVLYGAYAFLEARGVRFVAPGEEGEVVPKGTVSLAGLRATEQPDWARRGFTYWPYEFDEPADWVDLAAKLRLNTILFHAPTPDWWERERAVLLPELRRRGIHPEFGGHFLPGMLPRALFAEHPDWFRMHEGKRVPDWNFCPSQPEAVALVAQGAAELVRRNPEPEVFSIWPDDLVGGGWCDCPRCQGMTPSDQSLFVMNALACSIRQVRANAKVVFLSYQDTELPPTRVRPEPGVTLLWAPRERCYVHSLDDDRCPRNREYRRRLEGQLQLFDPAEAEAFEYYLDQILYQDLVPTLPRTIAGDLRYYRRLGMKVIEPLMVSLVPYRSLLANMYLNARLQWNENADTDALLRDLCAHYFGDAAVAEYYQHREAALEPVLARCYEGTTMPPREAARLARRLEESFTREFPAALGVLMRARMKAADPAHRRRLEQERAGLLQTMARAEALATARLPAPTHRPN